jgi:hypothetical protein
MDATAPSAKPIALSVVVPVFNGARFITETMRQLIEYLRRWPGAAEVIVIDDGWRATRCSSSPRVSPHRPRRQRALS